MKNIFLRVSDILKHNEQIFRFNTFNLHYAFYERVSEFSTMKRIETSLEETEVNIDYPGESGWPSWLRRRARFGIVDDDVRARGPGSSLASV